jgi:four helix bundle protein
MHDFRRLHVWQRSRELAIAVHALTRNFPPDDRGVVAGQLRRSVFSIPANIAEGCGKSSRKETIRFLQIASGSTTETENHLVMATDLHYITQKAGEQLTGDIKAIQRMLGALIKNLP